MSFEQVPLTSNSLEKKSVRGERIEKKQYHLETGEIVEVLVREFSPENLSGNQNVVFLPGWAMSSDSGVVKSLGESFAERTKSKSYTISTRIESEYGEGDVLLKEAEAISKFIKERGLTNVIIAGHSQGGSKAIDLVSIIQQDSSIDIRGLVLLDSVGLYDQTPESLTKNFAKDALVNTPITMAKKMIRTPSVLTRGLAAGNAVTSGILRELKSSGISKGVKKMQKEVGAMAQTNPRLGQIKVPVIVMSGTEDTVSHPDKIIPPGEEERVIEEWKKKDEANESSTYIDPREKFLQEKMFPGSPYVRMVAPEKLGHHGLPFLRSESVANASIYLLKRHERQEQSKKFDLPSQS